MEQGSILVVEDDADIRDAVEQALLMEGYAVKGVSNGREALAVLEMQPNASLILLDLMMPVMQGWELLEAIRADLRFSKIPVVLVSAVPPGRALIPETGLVQAEGLLEKPIDIQNLLNIVQKYCLPAHAA